MFFKKERISSLLLLLCVIFTCTFIMSNVLANNTLQVYKWTIDAGILTFPITYVLSDVFSEVYGYKWSRRVTWMAIILNVIFAILIKIACVLPHPIWFDSSNFNIALNGSVRIIIASAISYQLGDFVNDIIFKQMKDRNSNFALFPLRAIVSSFGGEIFDSFTFVMIAFYGTMPTNEILPMILLGVFSKTAYEMLILPVTTKVCSIINQFENN